MGPEKGTDRSRCARRRRAEESRVTSGAVASPVAVAHVPIDDLRPDPANPRRIGGDELEALTRSLREFGFVQPVLARREDRTVVGVSIGERRARCVLSGPTGR
jgi:ParB-like nuclease domain.